MRPRGRKRRAGISRRGGVSGFELTLAPSREGHAVESVREIDRDETLEALRTCSLAAVPPDDLLPAQEERDGAGRGGAAARISFVRLAPRQVVSMFEVIRGRDAGVRRLYADLGEGDFGLVGPQARGPVIRACATGGAARGEGIVMELPHTRADGTEAVFNVSVKGGMAGEGEPGEVRADYVTGTQPSRRSAVGATRAQGLRN